MVPVALLVKKWRHREPGPSTQLAKKKAQEPGTNLRSGPTAALALKEGAPVPLPVTRAPPDSRFCSGHHAVTYLGSPQARPPGITLRQPVSEWEPDGLGFQAKSLVLPVPEASPSLPPHPFPRTPAPSPFIPTVLVQSPYHTR